MHRSAFVSACLLSACLSFAGHASAAESYDNCSGFIETLPTVITTQGTWCLDRNLSTNLTGVRAIEIKTNNVTIDCNDFKIGGLAAGDASGSTGIYALDRQNVTVRNCGIRGFRTGIFIHAGAGHLVEDNRLDNNLKTGIYMQWGGNSLVRRNRVADTGGAVDNPHSIAIDTYEIDVVDNVVSGVFGAGTDADVTGIQSGRGTVRDNRISGLTASGTGVAMGIVIGSLSIAEGNHVVASSGQPGIGIQNVLGTGAACRDNTVLGFATGYSGCEVSVDNIHRP